MLIVPIEKRRVSFLRSSSTKPWSLRQYPLPSSHDWFSFHTLQPQINLTYFSKREVSTMAAVEARPLKYSRLTPDGPEPYICRALVETDDIARPDNEKRSFRFFTLPNNLRVMVIHDEECDSAAASLSVSVGSMFDGKVEGIAHFCEHMLFMGSEVYPDEDDYSRFITAHGGHSNAFTTDVNTCFYFDIAPDHLVGAVDRLAQFFISPLFSQSSTEREMNAVNSEHEGNVSSDGRRLYHLFRKVIMHPDHPGNSFGTGNLKTLRDLPQERKIDVRHELLKFHEKYYSANAMSLCVLGQESLDDLQALVTEKFLPVVNKNVNIPRFERIGGETPATTPELFQKYLKVVPVATDTRDLTVRFKCPSMNKHWLVKEWIYYSHIIGHEGEGSLLSALKREGLALGLMAGPGFDSAGLGVFDIKIRLTTKGESDAGIKRCLQLVWMYLRLVVDAPWQRWIWNELNFLNRVAFEKRTLPRGAGLVSYASRSLLDYPPERVFTSDWLLFECKKDEILAYKDIFRTDNMLLEHISQIHEGNTDKETEHYGAKYSCQPLSRELMDVCNKAFKEGDSAAVGMKLMEPNPFLPGDLSIKPCLEPKEYPRLLDTVGRPNVTMFHKQDHHFKVPRTIVKILFSVPYLADKDIRAYLLARLFTESFRESVNEALYPAMQAGYDYKISAAAKTPGIENVSMEFQCAGYSDKIAVFTTDILKKFLDAKNYVRKEHFDVAHKNLLRKLRNRVSSISAIQLCKQTLGLVLSDRYFSDVELLDELERKDVEWEEVTQLFLVPGLKVSSMEGLILGNTTREESNELTMEIAQLLKLDKKECNPDVPGPKNNVLKRDTRYCVQVPSTNSVAANHGTLLFVPFVTGNDFATTAFLLVANNWLHNIFFHELRTTEQLGYVVYATFCRFYQLWGPAFAVESSVRLPSDLRRRIEKFIRQHIDESLTEEEFKKHKEAIVSVLKQKYHNESEETIRHFHEVALRRYAFDKNQRQINYLESKDASLATFKKFVNDKILGAGWISAETFSPVNLDLEEKELPDGLSSFTSFSLPNTATHIKHIPVETQDSPGYKKMVAHIHTLPQMAVHSVIDFPSRLRIE